jgi:hypothetical protein
MPIVPPCSLRAAGRAAGAFLLTLLVAAAAYAAPPLVVGDPARPSAITVTDGSTYLTSAYQVQMNVACVAFVNHGPHTATKVGLNLAYVDATGTVLGVDFIYPTGKFFVDARSAFSGSRDQFVPNGNCHSILQTSARDSTFKYRMGRSAPPTDVAAILVSAREIVYDDGTAWRTDQLPQPGDHVTIPPAPPFSAAVPAGPPVLSTRAVTGSPIELNDAIAYGAPARMQSACVTFTNRDARVANRVNLALAYVDRTGTIVGVETLYNKGTYSQGITIDNAAGACTTFYGKADGDNLLYQPQGGGAAVPVGRIIASPLLVEFTDGTSWRAPNPPKRGDTVTAP